MSFFGVTEQDLQDGKAKFSGGETPTLAIASIIKKVIKGNDTIIVECVVMDGTQAGLKYSEFFRTGSSGGKTALGIFLTAFMTAKEAAAMTDPNVLLNKKFSCEFVSDGQYVNMRKVRAVSDVPQAMAQPQQQEMYAAPVAAPTAPVAAQADAIGQPALSKGLF